MSPLFYVLTGIWFAVAAALLASEASEPSRSSWAWAVAWIAWPATLGFLLMLGAALALLGERDD